MYGSVLPSAHCLPSAAAKQPLSMVPRVWGHVNGLLRIRQGKNKTVPAQTSFLASQEVSDRNASRIVVVIGRENPVLRRISRRARISDPLVRCLGFHGNRLV